MPLGLGSPDQAYSGADARLPERDDPQAAADRLGISLEQLYSRIGHCLSPEAPTKGDGITEARAPMSMAKEQRVTLVARLDAMRAGVDSMTARFDV
jgi:hypothetical protein